MLLAIDDPILPYPFLKMCLDSYVQGEGNNPEENYFISPALAPDELLSQLPPVRLFAACNDPLRD